MNKNIVYDKNQDHKTRLESILQSLPKTYNKKKKYLSAWLILAKIKKTSKDKETKKKARKDAQYFFDELKKLSRMR